MPLFFTVDEKLNFTLELIVDPLLKKSDLANLFKHTISIATKIQKEYVLFIEKEGRILGQERTQLIEDLDSLFSYLAILSNKLSGSFFPHDETHYRIFLHAKYNKMVSRGRIHEEDIAKIKNFLKGYELLIMSKIRELLLNFKHLMNSEKDKKGAIKWFEELYETIDSLLYNLLVIRYNLQNCLIDI